MGDGHNRATENSRNLGCIMNMSLTDAKQPKSRDAANAENVSSYRLAECTVD